MKLLISLFILTIPFYSIGVFLLGKYLSVSHVLALFVALGAVLLALERKLKKKDIVWAKYFFYFLLVAVFGLLFSPYAPVSYFKGVIQISGIAIMLCMSIMVVKYVLAISALFIELIPLQQSQQLWHVIYV